MPIEPASVSASPSIWIAVLSLLASGAVAVGQYLLRRREERERIKAEAARERRREQRAARVERRKEEQARKLAREREEREKREAQERERTAREQAERDRFERRLVLLEAKDHERDVDAARLAERLDRLDESLSEIKGMLRQFVGGSSPQLDPPPPMPRPRTSPR